MAKVKLYNNGQRVITEGPFAFKPKTAALFPADIAAKLKRLYPDELQDDQDVQDPFKNAEDAGDLKAAETPKESDNKGKTETTDKTGDEGKGKKEDPTSDKMEDHAAYKEAIKAGFSPSEAKKFYDDAMKEAAKAAK